MLRGVVAILLVVSTSSPVTGGGATEPDLIAPASAGGSSQRRLDDPSTPRGVTRTSALWLARTGGVRSLVPVTRDTCATERLLDLPRTAPSRVILAPSGEPGVPLVVRGRVILADGRPVPGVIVYAYQTNADGRYPKRPGLCGAARWHGYLRGFVMTDAQGRYEFITIRPGVYVERDTPAHVHLTVTTSRPPDVARMAYIDDVMFADDPLLDVAYRRRLEGRGGSGVVTVQRGRGDTLVVNREIRWDLVPGVAATPPQP